LDKLRAGEAADYEMDLLGQAADELSAMPIFIKEYAELSINEARSFVRRAVRRDGIGLVVIDYLQLMTDPEKAAHGRNAEVGSISRGISAMAKENNVAVICIAQLNRDNARRGGAHRPVLTDLRD